MSVSFAESKTKLNLLKAFAGESQARNRYDYAASCAKKNNLYVIEAIFKFTADQEKEHGEIFYNLLKEFTGENIEIEGTYPIDIYDNPLKLLMAGQHNEYEEHDNVYKSFAQTAKEEGFDQIALTFQNIAQIEKTHGDRFGRFAELLDANKLFVSDVQTKWMCLNCGFVFEGKEVPEKCPVCSHDKGYFIRLELAPYSLN